MKIITNKEDLASIIELLKQKGSTVGLVPTMGALHQGHISLIEACKAAAEVTVASIFVNPTQFNNPDDLINYPKPIAEDIEKLNAAGCDILFHPSVTEMYEGEESWDYEVGAMDSLLEGEFRPGHFKGVTQIVNKLFNAVKPDMAFFGQKDFQQFSVISKMVADLNLPIQLIACPIVREESGLAMSSRNVRLNNEERDAATAIYKALKYLEANYSSEVSIKELIKNADEFLNHPLLKLEYLRICNPVNLQNLTEKQHPAVALIACYAGNVRLIDNMMLA